MKKCFALYGMFAAMAIFVTACGDDSSSSASDPADEEYSSSIDDEESSSSEEEVSSSSTKKDGKSSSSEAKKDDKSSSSEKSDKSSSSEAKDDKSSSSEKPSSSSSEEPLVSVAPFCEVSVDEKNSEKLYVKYGVGTFSLSIAFDTGDKASVYLKKKGETCSQIMSIDDGDSYYGMAGVSCKVTNCSETDGIATYIEDCEVDKEASRMPTAAILKANYDDNCKYTIEGISKEAPTVSLNKEMLSADKYGVMVDMRQDARYVEGEDFYPYVYRTIKVGDQTWMAQNLDYESENGSSCYGGENNNCYEYGSLYTWEAAQDACPEGWRLPTTTEWNDLLTKTMGAESGTFDLVLTVTEYTTDSVSLLGGDSHTNTYGLSFILGGAYGDPGTETLEYKALHASGVYWLDGGNGEVSMAMVSNFEKDVEEVKMIHDLGDSQMQFSVRCVKDAK